MVRFLKRFWKHSKKPASPKNAQVHQTTDLDVERNKDAEGEYRSRDIRADKADGTDLTVAQDANCERDSHVTNRDETVGNEQLPTKYPSTLTPRDDGGNASECPWLEQS